jgi:hypothetical protein
MLATDRRLGPGAAAQLPPNVPHLQGLRPGSCQYFVEVSFVEMSFVGTSFVRASFVVNFLESVAVVAVLPIPLGRLGNWPEGKLSELAIVRRPGLQVGSMSPRLRSVSGSQHWIPTD